MALKGGYLEFEATLRGQGMKGWKIESLYAAGLYDQVNNREELITGAKKMKAAMPEFFDKEPTP